MPESTNVDDLFDTLLKRQESDTLDFKRELHDFASAEGREAFVKDVLCLANTPREESAYIVFGVDHTAKTGAILFPMTSQIDSAKIIDQLNEKAVSPRLTVRYTAVYREGKHFGILEIPVQREFRRPFLPAKDSPKLQKHALWFRRDTQNTEANPDEKASIYRWFDGGPPPVAVRPDTSGEWERFLETVCRFETGRSFLLIADRVDEASAESHAGICLGPWLGVFDFDPESEHSGLLAVGRATLEQHRSLQLVVKGQDSPIYPHSSTMWFFARGLAGRATTLQTGPYKKWLPDYGREVGDRVRSVAAAINPSPVTAVVLWNDPKLKDHLGKALEEVVQSFGEELTVVVISPAVEHLQDICEKYEAIPIRLTPRALALGLANLFTAAAGPTAGRCALPTRDAGISFALDRDDQRWFEQELELVHLDIGLEGERQQVEFARGEVVTWRDLQLRYDCDREITDKLRQRIEKELEAPKAVRVNFYHAPGAGGSTVARRVLWDLHTRYPCAVLHHCEPRNTADRLGRIYGLTQQKVLLLIDGSEHSETTINQLYDAVRSQQTPVVMLQVLRRFNPEAAPQRDFLLKAELSKQEADRFSNAYARLVPGRKPALETRAKSMNGHERTAFFFGLEAFREGFLGLPRFIEERIKNLAAPLRRVLVFLSIAHRYAQQPLPAQSFARMLQMPRDRALDFRKALPTEALELLIEASNGQWRTAHILIAEELLRQVLSPQLQDRDRLWRQAISGWAIDFAEFTRGDSPVPSEQMLEVARRTFIFRDNVELMGTERSAAKHFSQLLEEIPSSEGRLEVLRKLTDVYPEEAHFHAHLGRFCGLTDRFEEALQAVDRALKINPCDGVLHHMRGMTLRYQIYDLIDKNSPLTNVLALAKKSSEAFAEARRVNPENEHGYISEVQLLIKLLDYGGKLSKCPVVELLAESSTDPFLRESIDRAEELLGQVWADREGEKASHFAENCRARLDVLYGDHTKALQVWDSLLARKDIYKPPIRRQIIWTILRRRGDWDLLKPKELERCFQLLNENFAEGPNEPQSLRLWLRAIRYSTNPPSLDSIIERIGYWKGNTNSLDAAFYVYVLHMLAALEGSVLARSDAERAIEDCQTLASPRRNRTISFEWLGKGKGIGRLVHQSQLGEWADGFWQRKDLLDRVEGRIASIAAPQKGKIELYNGQMVFFVPAVGDFHAGRDENRQIDCFLGFSYDGPRAWEVHPVVK